MKTIYSLQEFREQVLSIANLVNEDYVTVEVQMDAYKKCTFRCYVNNYSSHTGSTMEESLAKLREKIAPLPPPNIDVMIEMGKEDIDLGKKDIEEAIEELTAFHALKQKL